MAISVTEKEHIRELIEKRINAEIEKISTENRVDEDDIKAKAKKEAIVALGIESPMGDLDALDAQIEKLQDKRSKLEFRTLEILDINPEKQRNYGTHRQLINNKIKSASVAYQNRLLEAHPNLGRIVQLKAEMDSLLQTIWIATSNTQVKELFSYLNDLLGTKPTQLEIMAQKIPPDQTA